MRKYVIAALTGLALTPLAIKAAYIYRGCYAIGGEMLLVPMLVTLVWFVEDIRANFKEVMDDDSQGSITDNAW